MTCQTAETISQKSLDGLLSQTERQLLDTHLETCGQCRREYDVQRRLATLADRWISHTLDTSNPGEAFTAQVMARLDTAPKSSWLSFGLPLTVTLLLLVALMLLPGTSAASAGLLVQTVHRLPLWLLTNFHALPGDALTMIRLPQTYLVPSWTGALLLAVIALNSAFCFHARQSALRRSLS